MIPDGYKDTKETILKNFNSKYVKEFLFHRAYHEIGQIQKMIMEDMENGFEDIEVPSISNEDLACIKENLNIIKDCTILYRMNNTIMSYISNLIMLINNWNDNTIKDQELSRQIISISNLMDIYLSFREIISINKVLLKEFMRFRDFHPVAYDTAKHFQDSLQKEIDEGKILNERNRTN